MWLLLFDAILFLKFCLKSFIFANFLNRNYFLWFFMVLEFVYPLTKTLSSTFSVFGIKVVWRSASANKQSESSFATRKCCFWHYQINNSLRHYYLWPHDIFVSLSAHCHCISSANHRLLVSSKESDGSIHQAMQTLLRNLIDTNLERIYGPEKVKKERKLKKVKVSDAGVDTGLTLTGIESVCTYIIYNSEPKRR